MAPRLPFERDVAAWFAANAPRRWVDVIDSYSHKEVVEFDRRWLQLLNTQGFGAPHVPREWGGGGYNLDEQVIIYREWARSHAPRLGSYDISLFHVPGTLLRAGSPDQQERYVRDAIDGVLWCQGFSEPNAGSDLAALQTTATRNGDRYIVNGQKIWSSYALDARYCLLLARTDPSVPKHHGISYFIMDMASPGIEIRPIRQATGYAQFCELFLDGVIIPEHDRIGGEGEGWAIAQSTLSVERGILALGTIEHVNAGVDVLDDGVLRHVGVLERSRPMYDSEAAVAVFVARSLAVRSTALDLLSLQAAGGAGTLSSVVKVASTEMLQDLADFGTVNEGTAGIADPHHVAPRPPLSGHWFMDWVHSWSRTISAGTNEIQRNIIAERVLALPRERGG